jgi:hypothetical protein
MAKYVLQTRITDTLASTMAAEASSCTLTTGNFGSPTGKQIITIDYDVTAKAADFLCTISGTAITSMTRLNGPDVEHSSLARVAMCFVDEHYSLLMDALNDGWLDPIETWTYASASTITVPSGAASKYSVGDKIKLTQTTVKYFYVTAVADTLLTVTGGSDYTVANAAITSNYYSHSNPVGFPGGFVLATNKYLTMDGKNAKIKIFGSIQGDGDSTASATMTYGITLTTLKSVTATCVGRKSTTVPATIGECVDQSSEFVSTDDATTAQVKVNFENISAGNIADTIWVGYSLVVEGII